MILSAAKIVFGIGLLLLSARVVVDSASRIAAHTGIKRYHIGAFLLATLTSMPEVAVGINAVLAGDPGVAVGTAFGSAVALYFLVMGAMVLSTRIRLHGEMERDAAYALALTLVAMSIVLLVGRIDFFVGLLLLLIYAGYGRLSRAEEVAARLADGDGDTRKEFAVLVAGIFLLFLAGHVVVDGVEGLAHATGISPYALAFFVVAVGTSLPELSVELTAVRTRKTDLAVGDLLGSGLADLTLVLGVTGIFAGLLGGYVPIDQRVLPSAAAILFGASYYLWKIDERKEFGLKDGVALILIYAAVVWVNSLGG